MTLAMVAAAGGCDKDAVERKRLTRHGGRPAVVVVQGQTSEESVSEEVEPNDEVAGAQVLASSDPIRGRLSGSDDVDRFLLEVRQTGLLVATVDGVQDADLSLALVDEEGVVLASSDRGPASVSEGVRGFPVQAGSKYQIVISEFVGRKLKKTGGRSGDSAPYLLRWHISEDSPEDLEVEPNNTLATAPTLLVGEERRGFVGWQGDVDVWRWVPSSAGLVNLVGVSGQKEVVNIIIGAVPGVALSLAVSSGDGEKLLKIRSKRGQDLVVHNFVAAPDQKSYEFRVAGKPSNPVQEYSLRVEPGHLTAGSEEEPNDDVLRATVVGQDDPSLLVLRGELSLGDVDMYRLVAVSHTRALSLMIQGSSHAKLEVAVVGQGGQSLAQETMISAGQALSLPEFTLGSGEEPTIRVRVASLGDRSEYHVRITLAPGAK